MAETRFKALPMLGGGAVGFVVAGPVGALVGAFTADAVTGGEGTTRAVRETQEAVKWAREKLSQKELTVRIPWAKRAATEDSGGTSQ